MAIIQINGASFAAWTGTSVAYGAGAPGTVYLQAAGTPAGAGTVIVDNGSTATNAAFTPLPAFSNSTENISKTVWVTTNKARLGLVTNAAIAGLTLNANGALELAGCTLTVKALTVTNIVYRNGIYTAANLSLLTDAVGGGQVVVQSGRGTVFIIR